MKKEIMMTAFLGTMLAAVFAAAILLVNWFAP